MANQFATFVGSVASFIRDHLLAIGSLFTLNCIENIITLFKRLLVVWPAFLSLLIGALLLTLSQVADLLSRPLDPLELTVLVVCLLLFWIIPLHLGSRILLNVRRRRMGIATSRQDRLDVWLPKDLGLLAILALSLAIWYQMHDYEVLTSYLDGKTLRVPRYLFWAAPVGCLVLFLAYLTIRDRTNLNMSERTGRRLAIGFTAVSVLLVFIASMAPFPVARLFGGLLFFPMLVGGWVMPLVGAIVLASFTTFWRRIVQSGIVIVVLALVLSDASSNNPFHDLRLLPENAVKSRAPAQMPIEAYIAEWKAKNACADKERLGQRCRAILIAAEGGASRAAFQVATVMGALLDDRSLPDLRDKLFLFSGVSGGSLGLATVRQALADSPAGRPPCKDPVGREGRHWIYYGTDHAKEAATSWRKCLQLLVSGDYLTPAVVGLALRDWWMALPAMLNIGLDDRSALLERAMEKHYAAVTGKECSKFEGLCSPFGHVDRSRQWLPALVLNSTLVERGQNIVVSDIDPASPFPAGESCRKNAGRLFPAHLAYSEALPVSYDLYELMDAKRKLADAKAAKAIRDISMSTAIVTSARFPVISSRGNIRNKDGDLVGKLVDGGYFDNSGLASILDIIDALSCNNVDSIVISIRNNPTDENTDRLWSFPGRTNIRQPPLEMADNKIDVAVSALDAFLNSRSGHVLENRFSAINRTGFDNFISSDIYKVICLGASTNEGACSAGRVEIKSLSMSWWLSTYVQLFIELQDGDTLLDQKCGEMHCRRRLIGTLAADLTKTETPAARTNERLDPGVIGLDSTIDVQRYAQ